MRLPRPFLQLPLRFDAEVLAAEVALLPESLWRPHPEGHRGNSALPLVARRGDADDDGVAGPMRPTPALAALPYLREVLAALGAVLGRTRLMRLDGNAEASAHSDVNYYWQDRYRVHVPVLTTPDVRFLCGDAAVHMAAGECWVFDTARRHNVLNPAPTRRIHLVADTVGSAQFAALLEGARDPSAPQPDWQARRVPAGAGAPAALAFEQENFPARMSPWELQARLEAVLAHCGEAAAALRAALSPAQAQWRALWAQYGATAEGASAFAAQREALRAALAPWGGRISVDGLDAVAWIEHTALRPALGPLGGQADADARKAPSGPADTVATSAASHSSASKASNDKKVSNTINALPERRSAPTAPSIERPVFLICPPRSGSSLLFETLARLPGLYTVGGESHGLIEGIPALGPAARGHDSNRLAAADATPATVAALRAAFAARAHDRSGAAPTGVFRLLEKTPKNALRVPFLDAAFPDARFVYLYRDPRETLASMIDAWQSGRFVTYRDLPGWPGPAWSLLLTPGWRDLAGRPLAEIVARQWSATVQQALDDLEALAPERWCVASYDRLVAEPATEIARLAAFLDVDDDGAVQGPLPLSRHTLTSPDPDKWRRHAPALKAVLPYFEPAAQRAREVFAQVPPIAPPRRRSPAQNPAPRSAPPAGAEGAPFRSVHTPNFAAILRELGVSLAVSTYQSGRLVLVRADGDALNTHLRHFKSPMGLALRPGRLALGTLTQVHEFADQPAVAAKLPPPGRHDACYVSRRAHTTGDIRVHELAYDADARLWIVNTRFSCLCTVEGDVSFVPRWRPRFVSALAAEDRCHLNGLALEDGRVRYVSALGATDTPQGWREHKTRGGVLLDVPSGETVAQGLCMPHSPRVHEGALWLLESGKGEIGTVQRGDGRIEPVAQLPGFTRGLAFAGRYAFVGLSQVREKVFDGLPLAQRLRDEDRACGVWVIDLRRGAPVAMLRFGGIVQEIFDVQVLPHRYPEVAEPGAEVESGAFVLPDAALAEVAPARLRTA